LYEPLTLRLGVWLHAKEAGEHSLRRGYLQVFGEMDGGHPTLRQLLFEAVSVG
jgi:hypothetical protein